MNKRQKWSAANTEQVIVRYHLEAFTLLSRQAAGKEGFILITFPLSMSEILCMVFCMQRVFFPHTFQALTQ